MTDPFAKMAEDIHRVLGKTAVYSDGDIEKDVSVILSRSINLWGDTVSVQSNQAFLTVQKSELKRRPKRGDTFTIGDDIYYVESVQVSDDLEHTVLAVPDE